MLKNKLFKNVLLAGAVGATLLLTACGNEQERVSQEIEYSGFVPDAAFISSDLVNLTNQEAFDLMIENPMAIHILLELVDYALLREDFEVNTENTTVWWEDFRDNNIPDLDQWFMTSGFNNEAEVIRHLEVMDLRTASARQLADVDEESIQTLFESWYGHTDYELADRYDDIRSMLIDQAAEQLSGSEVIRLRAEAGLEIFNPVLAAAYESFLEDVESDETLAPVVSEVEDNVVARINEIDITVDELFHFLTNQLGMGVAFEQLDDLLTVGYYVDPADVYEQIEEVREMFGEEFYEVIESVGFATIEELFVYLEGYLIDEVIVRAHRIPTEEDLQAIHGQLGETAAASHILVGTGVPMGTEPTEEERLDARNLAEELIERLQAADDDEFAELFAEFAAEYSDCPSGVQDGGDLGTWERGRMVPEFDHAVFEELLVGEFTLTPVWNPTHNGYHIIYKTDASVVPTFEEAYDDLVSHFINMQLQMGALDEIMMDLRLATGLEFGNPVLQARFELMAGIE